MLSIVLISRWHGLNNECRILASERAKCTDLHVNQAGVSISVARFFTGSGLMYLAYCTESRETVRGS